MTVTVYARHSSQCSKSKEKNAGQWKRCKCPLWLQWNTNGNQFKKSAKTRSWDIATKAARKLEEELELEANGIEPRKKPDYITIEAAARSVLGRHGSAGDQRPLEVTADARPPAGLCQRPSGHAA